MTVKCFMLPPHRCTSIWVICCIEYTFAQRDIRQRLHLAEAHRKALPNTGSFHRLKGYPFWSNCPEKINYNSSSGARVFAGLLKISTGVSFLFFSFSFFPFFCVCIWSLSRKFSRGLRLTLSKKVWRFVIPTSVFLFPSFTSLSLLFPSLSCFSHYGAFFSAFSCRFSGV